MEKNELVERLYALRAGISLLAMQFDKYNQANREKVQQIYLDVANRFKNIMEEKLYQSKGEYDHYFEYPDLTCSTVSRFGNEIKFRGMGYRSDQDVNDALCGKYWVGVLSNVFAYDVLFSYHDDPYRFDDTKTKTLKLYPNLIGLVTRYKGEETGLKSGRIKFWREEKYDDWKRLFDKQPWESRVVRDYIVDAAAIAANKINYDCISFHKSSPYDSIEKYDEWECAAYLLNNVICGRWLFTEEARTHFQTKLKELNEVIDAIRSDSEKRSREIEELRPKGLAKIFNKNKNDYIIERYESDIKENDKRIDLGNIAIANLQKGIAFLDNEIPKAKALIEEKEREMERAKAEYVLMLQAIQEEFADVLDKRDWQDVDLLIYYFESGRADNLKEALLQVDNERRTNRIVDTIKEATDRICWTLKTGFETLNRTLQQGFAAIESRIKQQNVLLAKQNELIAQQNDLAAQQNAELSNLVSAANLSNALLAKQNESSEQLVSKMTTLEHAIVG